METNTHTITVSVVFATQERQTVIEQRVPRGTNALELIKLTGLAQSHPELAAMEDEQLEIGVYGQKVSHDYLLEEGDRVEVYRPLKADPKEVRRQLALIGKTMGKK